MKKLLWSTIPTAILSFIAFLLSPWFPNTAIQVDLWIVGGVFGGLIAIPLIVAYIIWLSDVTN